MLLVRSVLHVVGIWNITLNIPKKGFEEEYTAKEQLRILEMKKNNNMVIIAEDRYDQV